MSILTHTKKTIKLKKQQTCMNKMKPSIKETGGGDSLSLSSLDHCTITRLQWINR